MKGRILKYDYPNNIALMGFDADFSDTFDKYHDKDINIEIKLWRPKRSGAANRYLWVLIDKIARETHLTKNEVYRNEIKEIGGVSDVYLMLDIAVDRFCKQWESQGLGWQTEIVGSEDGKTTVIAYYGSSTFDVEQMNQLIENVVFEAKQLGINTDTPDRQAWIESLLEEGEKRYGRQHNCS